MESKRDGNEAKKVASKAKGSVSEGEGKGSTRRGKLNDAERKEIVDGVLQGLHNQTYYAEKFGVSKPYVSQLLKTVRYPGLKGPVKPRKKKLPRCQADDVSYEECLSILPVAILYCEMHGLQKEMDMLERALRSIMRDHTKKKMKVTQE